MEALISRKIERLLACIRIRRFLRQKNFSLPIAMMQRRRSISSEIADTRARSKSYVSVLSAASSVSTDSKYSHKSNSTMLNVKVLLPETSTIESEKRKSIELPSDSSVSASRNSCMGLSAPVVISSQEVSPHELTFSDVQVTNVVQLPECDLGRPIGVSSRHPETHATHSSQQCNLVGNDNSNPTMYTILQPFESFRSSSIKSDPNSDTTATTRNSGVRDGPPSGTGSFFSTSSFGSNSGATNHTDTSSIGHHIPQQSHLNSTVPSSSTGKAKDFLHYGKTSHRATHSYNSSLQNLIYSKGLSEQSYGSGGTVFVSQECSMTPSISSNGVILSRSSSPSPAASAASEIGDLTTHSKTSNTPYHSATAELESGFPTALPVPEVFGFLSVNSCEFPISSSCEENEPQKGDLSYDLNRDNSAHADSISIQSDNFSFFEYPVRNQMDGCRDFSTLPVRVTVPLVEDQYKSSDEEEEDCSLDSRALSRSGKYNRNDDDNGNEEQSVVTLQQKPNLIGSIKMEDYFVSNKSKSESMIDLSNISPMCTRGDDCGDAANARESTSVYLVPKDFLHSNSMISSLCQDDESQDDAATMISSRTQQPQQILENSKFLKKGISEYIFLLFIDESIELNLLYRIDI